MSSFGREEIEMKTRELIDIARLSADYGSVFGIVLESIPKALLRKDVENV